MIVLEFAFVAIGIVVVVAMLGPVLAMAYKRYANLLNRVEKESNEDE